MSNIQMSTDTDNTEVPNKTVCFFQGNRIILQKEAIIKTDDLIIVELEDVVPEDMMSEFDNNFIIWKDLDLTYNDIRYEFSKFYVLPGAKLIIDWSLSNLISNNTIIINNVDALTVEQRTRRDNRLQKSLDENI